MPDNTCFKLSIVSPDWDNIRAALRKYGALFQVFIPKESPCTVYVKYKQSSSASSAKEALANHTRVASIEAIENWPFEKRPPNQQKMNSKGDKTSGESLIKEVPDYGFRLNTTKCTNCHSNGAELVCSVCSAWYCSETCQLKDWPNHHGNCIPRLVRGFPILPSISMLNKQIPTQQVNNEGGQQRGSSQNQSMNSSRSSQTTFVDRSESKPVANGGIPSKPPAADNGKPKKQLNTEPIQSDSKANAASQRPVTNATTSAKKESVKEVVVPKETKMGSAQEKPPGTASAVSPLVQTDKNASKKHMTPKAASPERKVSAGGGSAQQTVAVKPPAEKDEKPVAEAVSPKDPSEEDRGTTTLTGNTSSMLMKRMQKKVASGKRTIPYGPFPAVGSIVTISYVSDKMIFIHEHSKDLGDPFSNFVRRCMQQCREEKLQLTNPPALGDIVFAPFDDSYYRAIVEKVTNDTALVTFPDFGNQHSLAWKLMKEITDVNLKYATCVTHAAMFSGVPQDRFPPGVYTFLTELIEEHPFVVTHVEPSPLGVKLVELRHQESNYMLSAKLGEIAKAKQAATPKSVRLTPTDPETYTPVFGSEFTDPVVPQDRDREVALTIVEASEFIDNHLVSAILNADKQHFGKIMGECQQYGMMDPNQYNGEEQSSFACLVKYDSTWCRALKLSTDTDDQYYLLDLGVIRELDKSYPIRRYPPALSRKLYCSEFVVDNPEILINAMKKGDNSTDSLAGLCVTAQLYIDRTSDQFRMKITAIEQ